MSRIFLSDNYRFFNFQFREYRYTDARAGCDLHFLALLVKGNARIVTDGQTLHIRQGDAFYIPKGLRYQSYWYGDPEIEFLSLGFLNMPLGDRNNYLLQTIPDPELPELLRRIPTPGRQVDSYALSLFYAALARAIPQLEQQPSPPGQGLAHRAMAYIRSHPHAQMPEVACACGVSQPHLYATFRQVAGTTPNDYRQSVLCQIAIDLLTTTDKTVEEISGTLGFSSAAYFRKVLHKHTGMTPRQIRQSASF